MARFYANENFPLPAVLQLRALGHDVLTTRDVGQSDRALPDEEVLRFAVFQERSVLTLNRRHFIRLHQQFPDHRGIIVCTFDSNFERQAQVIHQSVVQAGELSGKLLRINRA